MYHHAKNQLDSSIRSETRVGYPCLTRTTQKLVKKFLTFLNLHQHVKTQLILCIHSSIHLVTRVAAALSDHKHPNIFLSTLNFNYHHVKSRLFHQFVLEIYFI